MLCAEFPWNEMRATESSVQQLLLTLIMHIHKIIINVCLLQDFDVLIIPGGWAPDYWRRDKRFLDLVKTAFDEGKIVAAICHGPWLLCSAKVLPGKRLTCFHSIKDDVINAGCLCTCSVWYMYIHVCSLKPSSHLHVIFFAC